MKLIPLINSIQKFASVSDHRYAELMKRIWKLHQSGYAISKRKGGKTYWRMHEFITGKKPIPKGTTILKF